MLNRKLLSDLRAYRGQFFAVWLVITLGVTFYGAQYPSGVNMRAPCPTWTRSKNDFR